jgi:acyl carrier protein
MGLDSVEFVMALEESFALYIPDADAVALTTPRKVIDYLEARLPSADSSQCLDQMAFHRVRRAAMRVLEQPRNAFAPETRWKELLREKHHRRQWELVGQATGLPRWPRLSLWGSLPSEVETVGGTARFLATKCPSAVKGEEPAWTKAEITEIVTRLMENELGITKFKLDDEFVQDLGVD